MPDRSSSDQPRPNKEATIKGLGKCDCGCGRKHQYAHHRIFEGTGMWFAELRCIASYQQNGYVEQIDIKPINGSVVFAAGTHDIR